MIAATQVVKEAAQALQSSSHPSLRTLRLEEGAEALVVSGKVTSWYLKQLAQETIMPYRGTLKLVNNVAVIG